MATTFTLELVGGANQSFAAWGITGAKKSTQSLAADSLHLIADGLEADATRLFSYGDVVKLHRITTGPVDTVIFVGVCRSPQDNTSGGTEGQAYEFVGVWDYLENIPFQQLWRVSDGLGGLTTAYRSRVHLFSDLDGNYITIVAQITEILNYALTAIGGTAPFVLGTIEPATYCPPREAVDISCAEAVRQCLRFAPDAVAWVDYATTPPTVNIRPVANITAAAVAPIAIAERFNIERNRQQECSQVVIFYEIGDPSYPSVNSLSVDAAPGGSNGRAYGALCATVSLQGGQASMVQTQELQSMALSQAIDADAGQRLAWWVNRIPELKKGIVDGTIVSPVVDLSSVVFRSLDETGTDDGPLNYDNPSLPDTYFPRELTFGGITPWMQDAGGASVFGTFARAMARLSFAVHEYGTAAFRHAEKDIPIAVNLVATDATSKVHPHSYKEITGGSFSEVPPVGLAAALYTALNRAQYAGSLALVAEEIGDVAVGVGNKLNLTGLRAEWTTMQALITQCAEDLFAGTTTLTFGPTPQLALGDLVELLQASRWRRIPDVTARATGNVGGGRQVDFPSWTPQTKGTLGKGAGGNQVFAADVAANGAITLDVTL